MKPTVVQSSPEQATQDTPVYVRNGPKHGVFGVLLRDGEGWYFEPQNMRAPERVYFQLWKRAEEEAIRWRVFAVMALVVFAICVGALVHAKLNLPGMISP